MPSGSFLTTNKINKSEESTQEQSVCVGDLPYFKTHYEDTFFLLHLLDSLSIPTLAFLLHTHLPFSILAVPSPAAEQKDNVISQFYVIFDYV